MARDRSDRYVFIGLGAVVALAIVLSRREKLMAEGSEDFREGYAAGFLTPGPFTILAFAGLAGYHS